MPKFRCRDLGYPCLWEGVYDTEEKLLKKIREHAKRVHNIKPVPPEVMEVVLQAIRR
jgi:predicted small metal-binding protein